MLKATIKIEISGDVTAASQVSGEAPTLDMLKTTVIRTTLLQLPDLVKHVFEAAAKPPPEKPKELESAKQETKAPAKAKAKAKAKPKPAAVGEAGPPAAPAGAPAQPALPVGNQAAVPEQQAQA